MSDGGGRDRFLTEILEQPDALRRAGAALVAQRDRLDHLAAFAASPGPIVLTGMGGSLDACHAAATALAAAGIMATVRGASERPIAVPPTSTTEGLQRLMKSSKTAV